MTSSFSLHVDDYIEALKLSEVLVAYAPGTAARIYNWGGGGGGGGKPSRNCYLRSKKEFFWGGVGGGGGGVLAPLPPLVPPPLCTCDDVTWAAHNGTAFSNLPWIVLCKP